MYKVAAYSTARPNMPQPFNSWPPTARQIHKQGRRKGNAPRPVMCVRVKARESVSRSRSSIVDGNTMKREHRINMTKALKAGGSSNVTIAKGMNISESSVRSLLKGN